MKVLKKTDLFRCRKRVNVKMQIKKRSCDQRSRLVGENFGKEGEVASKFFQTQNLLKSPTNVNPNKEYN